MSTPLTTSEKMTAWFAIVVGLLTSATPFLVGVSSAMPSAITTGLIASMGAVITLAGVYGLKAKSWAFWLLFGSFLIQSFEYFSQDFSISFMGPISIKFGWGYYTPPSHINLNVLAILVCVLAYRSASRLTAVETAAT
jgi:hypothetical protein